MYNHMTKKLFEALIFAELQLQPKWILPDIFYLCVSVSGVNIIITMQKIGWDIMFCAIHVQK